MNVSFIFNDAVTPQAVSKALGVDLSSAYRWKNGGRCDHIAELIAAGFLTADDLRRQKAKRSRKSA